MESELHKLLKHVGMAYLFNQNCFLVASEVEVSRGGQARLGELDNHFIIDVCGVGDRYVPEELREYTTRRFEWQGQEVEQRDLVSPRKTNIVRGIEVKVSKADFLNGFVCQGCNYNYLMVPEGLIGNQVWSYQVPKEVGILAVDSKTLKVSFDSRFESHPFDFHGLRIVRKPAFRQIEQFQIDRAISSIGRRATTELINKVAIELRKTPFVVDEGKEE